MLESLKLKFFRDPIMKKLLLLTSSISLIALLSGCSLSDFSLKSEPSSDVQHHRYAAKSNNVYNDLNGAIVELGNQLLANQIAVKQKKKIAITSFVDLNQLNKTTTFGRVLGESMINELHVRGFKVSDFRGQDAIAVNSTGEFHLTRDIAKLRPQIANSYILVGTYSLFDYDSIAINARLINFDTGDVISSARIVYTYENCKLFDLCQGGTESKINIIADNCAQGEPCPNSQCAGGICQK